MNKQKRKFEVHHNERIIGGAIIFADKMVVSDKIILFYNENLLGNDKRGDLVGAYSTKSFYAHEEKILKKKENE